MNKKFSTLVAAAALFFGAVSANAAGKPVTSLDTSKEYLYQLKYTDTDPYLLGMNADGKLIPVAETGLTSDKLASTLWCVEVLDEHEGQNVIYNFVNKSTGQRLDIAYSGTALEGLEKETESSSDVIVGGEIAGWAFSPQYKSGMKPATIYSHFSTDSVLGLYATASAIDVKKTGSADAAKEALATPAIFTQFTLQTASPVRLKAAEINSKLGLLEGDDVKGGIKLGFEPNEKGVDAIKNFVKNPFTTDKFLAEEAETDYVFILHTDSSYLYVDTAYTNNAGSKFLAFDWSKLNAATRAKGLAKHATAKDSIEATALKDQFKFAFTYYPSVDSLIIQVKKVARTNDANPTWAGALTNNATTAKLDNLTGNKAENNFITVQDLLKDQVRIITVADVKESDVTLGYKGCAPLATDKTSKDNGLYVIYNAKDQVLASPIHKNGTAYEWVTLDAQDPEHMPAYQWLVQKNQNSESLKETSSLKLTNREFKDAANSVQLREKDGKIVVDAFTVGGFTIATGTAVRFEQIKDSTILKDSYLGYKKFDKDSLTIAQYKFNYLHKFEKNSWIKRGEDKDSVLYAIKDDYTAFTITEGNVDKTYGATAPNVDGLKGIAQLKRTQYLVSLKADTVGVGAEDRIVLGKVQKDSVYFKENNHFDGSHYFAMLEADAATNSISTTKVSVSDAGVSAYLKSQPLTDATTSAFAISVDDVPLYRRFNTSLENAVAGQEDSTKVLRFKEYYRGEYLMDENNQKFQDAVVNYAGIERADKATGLSFYVDTAILKSTKAGYIKPQYFIYLNPEIQPATPAVPCPLDHNHGVDADGNPLDAYHCSHAEAGKPGYMKAQYLVSFADSVSRPAANADKLYKFGEYTRVGFVDGLRMGDSLYILTNGFEKLALADLDTAKIKAAYKAAKIEFNIINLKAERTDAHHNYTWSFRFVDPEKAASLVEEDRRFLIESAKKTGDKDIAPEFGAWLKSQNGCLVLSDKATSEFNNTKTGGDNALIFNIENGSEDDMATDNEAIATSEVTVIAQNGAVRIANAEGKKVVITNILGQTIANTVITSSDAVIAAPAGVVVVAVEGEEAVKAIVK